MSNSQLAEFEKLMEEKAGLKGLSEFENMMKSLKVEPSNPLSEPIEEPKPKIDISNKFFEALELKKVELNQLKGLSEFENMMKSLTVDLSNPLIEPIEEPKKAENVLEDKSIVDEFIEDKPIKEEPKHNNDLISNVTSLIERDKKEGKLEAISEQLSQTESERIDRLERWISRIASTGPGSGETKLLRLDDVDITELGNDKFLKYNSSTGKLVFAEVSSGEGGAKHVIQKNDLEDGTDATTSLGDKTNLLFDSNTFRVSNDAGSDSTQIRLTTEFTGITNGTAAANKALILGSARAIDNIGAMTSVGSYSGGAVTSTGTVSGTKLVSSGSTATSIETSGGITMAGVINGATTINALSLDLLDTDSEAVAILHRNQTGSNGNSVGKVKFKGQNSADEEINFAQINGIQKTVTDGAEDGQIDFGIMNGGTLNTSMRLDEDGIDISGSRTIKFGGADAFRIVTTQASTALAISNALSGYAINDSIESDGRIKIEIDGVEYYIPIYNV